MRTDPPVRRQVQELTLPAPSASIWGSGFSTSALDPRRAPGYDVRILLFVFQFNIRDIAQFFYVFGRNFELWLAELLQDMPRQTRNFLIA